MHLQCHKLDVEIYFKKLVVAVIRPAPNRP